MPPTSPVRLGNNLLLSSCLALFSFVPFEYVAKGTLVVAVLLFIGDPLPPTSRLLSLVLLIAVSSLSRIHRKWKEGQPETHIELSQERSNETTDTTTTSILDDDKKQA
jgi:hypothetical protein